MSKQAIEISGEVRLVTEKAIQFYDGKSTAWVPKSQIKSHSGELKAGNTACIFLPEWMAKDKGFI